MPNHGLHKCPTRCEVGQLQDQPTLRIEPEVSRVKSPEKDDDDDDDDDDDVPFWLCCLGMNLGNAGLSWPV